MAKREQAGRASARSALLAALRSLDAEVGTAISRSIATQQEGDVVFVEFWDTDRKQAVAALLVTDIEEDANAAAQLVHARCVAVVTAGEVTGKPTLIRMPDGSYREGTLVRPPPLLSRDEEQRQVEAFMAQQPKETVMVDDETPVSLNGYRVLLRAGVPQEVPAPIAHLLRDSQRETAKAMAAAGRMPCMECGQEWRACVCQPWRR